MSASFSLEYLNLKPLVSIFLAEIWLPFNAITDCSPINSLRANAGTAGNQNGLFNTLATALLNSLLLSLLGATPLYIPERDSFSIKWVYISQISSKWIQGIACFPEPKAEPIPSLIGVNNFAKAGTSCTLKLSINNTEFELKIININKELDNYKKELNKELTKIENLRNNANGELIKIVNDILIEYSGKNSIDLIINKKSVIIGKSDLEITSEIIKILNDKIKKINLK